MKINKPCFICGGKGFKLTKQKHTQKRYKKTVCDACNGNKVIEYEIGAV